MKKLLFILICSSCFSQEIALLKYHGGGDWYANPTSLPNLIRFCNLNINTKINPKPITVESNNPEILNYPYVHATGHGNIVFSEEEEVNIRNYILSGGFLHIDDNYGMNDYIQKAIKKMFPNEDLIEIPSNHALFQSPFKFPNGLPKIHEHDNKRPQAFGLFIKNRLVLLYTFECDLGDGWEDADVHNDPESVRLKALQMGANIMNYIFKN